MSDFTSTANYDKATVSITTPEEGTYTYPYSENITFSASQHFIQPVQQFFKDAGEGIRWALGKSNASGLYGLATETIPDLFGFKLYNKDYFVNAWHSPEPAIFDLTIKFQMGMLGQWSGETEVFRPIQSLMRCTLPKDGGANMLVSPSTNAAGAFYTFARTYISSAWGSSGAAAPRTWAVKFGSGKGQYLVLDSLVAERATLTYANKLDDKGYPISGSITLHFKSSSIPTQTDFGGRRGLIAMVGSIINNFNL